MIKVTNRVLPWAILLAVVCVSVVLYFAAMLEVIGRLSKERDDLGAIAKKWFEIELAIAEGTEPSSGLGNATYGERVNGFRRQLTAFLDLPWFSVLRQAYPQLKTRSLALRSAVSELAVEPGMPLRQAFIREAKGINDDLNSLISWIGEYSAEQMTAFRVLLVFLAAFISLAAVLLLGVGNLLRIQEARFLAAIDSMSDALIVTDANNAVIHANPSACELFGISADRLQGRPPPQALEPRQDEAIAASRGSEAASPGDPIEAFLTDSSGRRRPVSLKVERIREPSGKSRGSVYLIRDLTEWKKLVASISSTFVTLQIEDADRAVTRALEEAASLCSAEIRSLVLFGATGNDAAFPAETSGGQAVCLPPLLRRWTQHVAAGGEPVYLRAELAHGDPASVLRAESLAWAAAIPLSFGGTVTGAIALASRRASPPWGESQMTMVRILGSLVIELLAKKWVMREMNRLGFEYKDLIEHANVPIWGVDSRGIINEWNQAMILLTGSEKSRALGLAATPLIDPTDGRGGFAGFLAEVLAGGRITEKELMVQAVGKGPSTLLVSGSTRQDSSGKVIGALFIGQDISARVAGEQRIKELARSLVEVQEIERLRISQDLHDNVAQDLSAARIACETLFDGLDQDGSVLRQRVAGLSSAIASSLQSIRSIAYDLRTQDINQYGLVTSLDRLCGSYARPDVPSVTFQSAGVEKLPLGPDEALNIYRIVQEALANARRHANARSVTVTLVHSHPDLILRITDDGVGFDVERTFAEAAERRCMGLVGIRERTAILRGTLTIASRIGKGTQIKVTIPFESTEKPDGAAEKHSPHR